MIRSILLFAAFTIASVTGASAATYSEIGDAGGTIATAQAVPDGTTTIQGFLSLDEEDVFALTYGTDVLFEASNIFPAIGGFVDLSLLDGAGTVLDACFDCFFFNGGVGNTVLSVNLTAGTYYLLLDAYNDTSTKYSVDITATSPMSQIPLPAGLPLLLSGFLALGIARRRRS